MRPEPRHLIERTFPAGLPSLHALRSLIVTSMAGVAPQVVSDVELIATELVTNAHLHGRPPTRFRLSYLADPTRVRMEVGDTGPAQPHLMHPDDETHHGRGLLLVQAVSTAWGVIRTDAGKTVWAEFGLGDGVA